MKNGGWLQRENLHFPRNLLNYRKHFDVSLAPPTSWFATAAGGDDCLALGGLTPGEAPEPGEEKKMAGHAGS